MTNIIDSDKWVKSKDAWSCRELAFFLCGKDPSASLMQRGAIDELNEMIQEIERAVFTKKLKLLDFPAPVLESIPHTDFWYFDNIIAIQWAVKNINKYQKFPFNLEDVLSKDPSLQGEKLIDKVDSIKSKAAQQQELIISIVKSMDINPYHLPEEKRGKEGLRSRVKKIALEKKSIFTDSSFSHAWKNFRKNFKGGSKYSYLYRRRK